MEVKMTTEEAYQNFGRCVRLTNGTLEVLVTVDVGPRIIKCARTGGVNIMFNDVERAHFNDGPLYDSYYYPGAKWNIYGGHRLWAAPEEAPATAYPDNQPVAYEAIPNGARFVQQPQKENGIALRMEVVLHPEHPELRIVHSITNISEREKTFAVWALSVLAPGGTEIIPQNTADTGLLPNRCVSMWPYCDFSDERLSLGHRYAVLKQDSGHGPFKMGFDNTSGRVHYLIGDTIFTKRYFPNHPDGIYADYGCSFETYTNELFLEMETLGELKTAAPGETLTHVEEWKLSKNQAAGFPQNEEQMDELLKLL